MRFLWEVRRHGKSFRLEAAPAQAPAIIVLTFGLFRRASRILSVQDHQFLSEQGRLDYILTTLGAMRIPAGNASFLKKPHFHDDPLGLDTFKLSHDYSDRADREYSSPLEIA
jgi:hypothetical protein